MQKWSISRKGWGRLRRLTMCQITIRVGSLTQAKASSRWLSKISTKTNETPESCFYGIKFLWKQGHVCYWWIARWNKIERSLILVGNSLTVWSTQLRWRKLRINVMKLERSWWVKRIGSSCLETLWSFAGISWSLSFWSTLPFSFHTGLPSKSKRLSSSLCLTASLTPSLSPTLCSTSSLPL